MGMNEQDGGPAFPVWELNGNGRPEMTEFGMSLRDCFATKAMAPVITEAYKDEAWKSGEDWRVGVALDCYKRADAMLEARKRHTGQFRDEAPERWNQLKNPPGLQPSPAPEPFRITGPGVYRRRCGDTDYIKENPGPDHCHWVGTLGGFYDRQGSWEASGTKSLFDLVARIL